jgi:hypothetical protein
MANVRADRVRFTGEKKNPASANQFAYFIRSQKTPHAQEMPE